MSFDVSTHPIYGSILHAIGADPDTGKYSPVPADVRYLIGEVPENQRNADVSITDALKTLEKEGFVKKIIEGSDSYFDLTKEGKKQIKSMITDGIFP